MERKVPLSDEAITRSVSRHLAGRGLRAPCRIEVQTRNGDVTLSGTVQFVHQRDTAVQAIRTVEGVKRITEKLKVTPPAKHQYGQPSNKPVKHESAEQPPAEQTPADEQQEPQADVPNPNGASAVPPAQPSPSPILNSEVSADVTFSLGAPLPAAGRAAAEHSGGLRHTRKVENYTFECANREEADRLRAVLAGYADWLKKNSWIGEMKADGEVQRVTFHAKSVIDFLRQQGF